MGASELAALARQLESLPDVDLAILQNLVDEQIRMRKRPNTGTGAWRAMRQQLEWEAEHD